MIITGTRVRGGRYYGGTATAGDTYFNLVSLLLPGNGTNGSQNNTFLDSSTNNFTVTRNGNTTQGTFSPFSQTGWSNYFDGSGDNLTVADNAAFEFGSGSFTVEMWFYLGASGNNALVTKNRSGTGADGGLDIDVSPTTIRVYIDGNTGTTLVSNVSTTISLNTWYHLAVVRSVSGGTNNYVFLNGVAVGTSTTSTAFADNSQPLKIGTDNLSGSNYNQFTGYISNLRIVKGTAVYTSDFTPPTAPLTAISGTSLLTCQSNRFIDNSTNAFAITVAGNTAVQAFAPFDPTAAYSAATVGGSAYLDGTGDYLSTSATQIIPASTTFSVEAWVYLTGDYSVYREIVTQGSSLNANRWLMFINITDGTLAIQTGGTSLSTSFVVPLNTWTHLAFVNNAGSYNIYANGTSVASGSNAIIPQNTYLTVGAFQTGTEYFQGYISNVRISNVARSITVPTSPYTSDGNTRFLMSAANGGITDATAKNVLETVGGAAISTTQSKFGGSAMAFDGSGDYLIFPSPQTQNFVYGTGNFTIELWFYMSALAGSGNYYILYDGRPTSTTGAYVNLAINNATPESYVNGATVITGSALSANTWYHFAYARSGSSTKMFINGSQVGSTYTDTTNYINAANRPVIGTNGFNVGQYNFNGYIDDLRITRGYARYTANFTPPTAAFPTQ